jgi:hypothetical protein
MITPKIKCAAGLVFLDSGERYRIKLRLSDGRLIYLTDGSSFTVLSKTDLVVDPRLEKIYRAGAYLSDLSAFSTRDVFERARQQFVTPVETIPELVESPVDASAFVLGGVRVHQFIAMHNPGLS